MKETNEVDKLLNKRKELKKEIIKNKHKLKEHYEYEYEQAQNTVCLNAIKEIVFKKLNVDRYKSLSHGASDYLKTLQGDYGATFYSDYILDGMKEELKEQIEYLYELATEIHTIKTCFEEQYDIIDKQGNRAEIIKRIIEGIKKLDSPEQMLKKSVSND